MRLNLNEEVVKFMKENKLKTSYLEERIRQQVNCNFYEKKINEIINDIEKLYELSLENQEDESISFSWNNTLNMLSSQIDILLKEYKEFYEDDKDIENNKYFSVRVRVDDKYDKEFIEKVMNAQF